MTVPERETDVPTPEERALIKAWSGTPDWTPDHGIPNEAVAKIWDGWTPEVRPIPEELTPDFDAVRHPKPATHFASWAEQLDAATFDTLKQLANGGVGEP